MFKGQRIVGTDEQLERADRRLFLRYGMAVTAGGIIMPARKHFIVPASFQDYPYPSIFGPVPGLGAKQAMWAMAGVSAMMAFSSVAALSVYKGGIRG